MKLWLVNFSQIVNSVFRQLLKLEIINERGLLLVLKTTLGDAMVGYGEIIEYDTETGCALGLRPREGNAWIESRTGRVLGRSWRKPRLDGQS